MTFHAGFTLPDLANSKRDRGNSGSPLAAGDRAYEAAQGYIGAESGQEGPRRSHLEADPGAGGDAVRPASRSGVKRGRSTAPHAAAIGTLGLIGDGMVVAGVAIAAFAIIWRVT